MAMLDRYRKSGGFHQLLSLLETCGPTKQEKFLEIIKAEDPRWADALKSKMLDMKRIYSWNDETLAEIVGTLQDLTLAIAIIAGDDATKARLLGFLSHGRKRKIDDLMGSTKPTPGEIATMHMKIIETVRKMALDGFLRFEKFDPSLQIEDKIEEQLAKATTLSTSTTDLFKIDYDGTAPAEAAEEPAANNSGDNEARLLELKQLKNKIAEMSKENAVLRHELSIARGKLDQIKKIA